MCDCAWQPLITYIKSLRLSLENTKSDLKFQIDDLRIDDLRIDLKWEGDAGYVEVIHACPGQHYHANTGYFIQFNYVTYSEYNLRNGVMCALVIVT